MTTPPAPTTAAATPSPLGAESMALPVPWLMLGTFVVALDFFAVNVAVPALGTALAASAAQLQWVVASFGLMYGAVLIAGARLGERHGTERLFGAGMALFALASAAAAAAPGLAWLIGARSLQGLAAALLTPQVLAIAGRLPDLAQRQRAFVGYGAALGLGAGLGPLAGAAVIEADLFGLGWRAIFVPQMLLAAAGALRVLASPLPREAAKGGSLDLASVAMLMAATVALVAPLIEGRRLGWPVWLVLMPACAAALLVAFWRRQQALVRRQRAPLVDPALLAQRRFRAALATVLAFYASNASCILVVSLVLHQLFGLRPLAAAAVYTVMSVGFIATTFGARGWFARFGEHTLTAGAIALAAGQAIIAGLAATGAPLLALLPALAFTGAAFGVVMSPLVARAVGVAPPAQAGLAGGVVVTVQWFGNALGVAVIGSVYFAVAASSAPRAAAVAHVLLALLALVTSALLSRWLQPAGEARR